MISWACVRKTSLQNLELLQKNKDRLLKDLKDSWKVPSILPSCLARLISPSLTRSAKALLAI